MRDENSNDSSEKIYKDQLQKLHDRMYEMKLQK